MNDRQLLELAAKAAGMEYPSGQAYCETLGVWGMLENRQYHWWNPLADDGDALRLAVKLSKRNGLGLTLILADSEDHTVVVHDCNDLHITEELDSDTSSATRRAIVRAAAQIGKEMA